MALEFPSWLEWMEWLVGSDWPHGNEDRMWQMGLDLEDVAADADGLIGDLDKLLADVRTAYPDGSGGDNILDWLKPLRDGDADHHGSLQELVDNYHSLAKAADDMGDQLQSAKLNFYIAGAWLVGELLWAAATGPFAPEAEAVVISTARVAFRELGEALAKRITKVITDRITNQVVKRLIPKLVYEIGQEALVETFQGTAQEFLVQTIQQQTGHTDGYDWGAMRDNAIISAIAGGAGGGVGGLGGHFLPTDMGGFKGAFHGAVSGATAGAAGAGAAWLGGGLLNGNWDFDPRSLTGGAFSGAAPGSLHGYAGHSGPDGGGHGANTDGSAPSTHDPAGSKNAPETDAKAPGSTNDSTGDGHKPGTNDPAADGHKPGANDSTADGQKSGSNDSTGDGQKSGANDSTGEGRQPGANGQDPGGNSQQPGTHGQDSGEGKLHSTSAPASDTHANAPAPSDHDTSRNDNHDASGNNDSAYVDNRKQDPKADVDGNDSTSGGSDSGSSHSADTHGRTDDTGTRNEDIQHGRADDTATGPNGREHPHDGPLRPEHAGEPAKESNLQPNTTAPVGATNVSANPGSTTQPGGPAAQASHSGPASHTSTNTTTPNSTTPNSDPAKAAPGARDGRLDGSAPRPVAAGPATPIRTSVSDLGTAPGIDPSHAGPAARASMSDSPGTTGIDNPMQAGRTGVEPTAPHAGIDSRTAQPETASGDRQESPAADHRGNPETDRQDTAPNPDEGRVPDDDLVPPYVPFFDPPAPADHAGSAPRDLVGAGRGNASPVGEFDGTNRPIPLVDVTPKFVLDQIKNNLGVITPEGVSWNGDAKHFLLPDGRTVTVNVGPTSNGNVAEFHSRPADSEGPGGFDVTVSERARDQDVMRALAHELAEIRLSTDPDIDILIDPDDDRPSRMSSHLGGRFAEIHALTEDIDRAAADPARSEIRSERRADLADLMDRLGFNDPDHANTVRQLLEDHDPALARRLELEEQGLNEHRPVFDPDLSDADFRQGADDHLNQLRQLLDGDYSDHVVRAEERALNGRMREELARRVFDPIMDPDAKPIRKLVRAKVLFGALDPINVAINDSSLSGPERAAAIHRAIDGFHDAMPQNFRDALGPEGFAQMHDAADGFADTPAHIPAVLDHATGRLTVDGQETTLGDFLRDIDNANRGARDNALSTEYVVVVHDAVDGKSSVEVLSRPLPQHRLPLHQNAFGPDNDRITLQQRPPVPMSAAGGHTIDVGVGRSAFGLEMTPDADRSGGGLIIKTELADAAIVAQRKRDQGLLDAGPLAAPGSVMVYSNMLSDGHLLSDGPTGDVARIYINNVSADLPDAAYDAIAATLADTLAPGGRVEVQWDMKPEEEGGQPGDRNHILGTTLWDALERHYHGRVNPFRVDENTTFPHPGNSDYDYSIDAGGSNTLDTDRMANIDPPLPEHRMVIVYEPGQTVIFDGNLPEGGDPLYRGVPRLLPDGSVNPAYIDGLRGHVPARGDMDLDYDGHTSHLGSESDATSWTRMRSTAELFAHGDGLIMEWRTGLPPEGATWRFKPIYDLPDGFAQVLIQGTLDDARATRFIAEPAVADSNPETTAAQPDPATDDTRHPDAAPDPTPSVDETHTPPGEHTDAGASFHPGDDTTAELARQVQPDPDRFTVDVHIDENGHARIGDRTYTPDEFADLVRRSNWDGQTPIRLIGCDAATNGFATDLARHLGVDVLAPTKPAWTDAHGNVYTSTTDIDGNGNRRPRIPPDGEWQVHHPDGTRTTATDDGFAPGTREENKQHLNPDEAGERGADIPEPARDRPSELTPHLSGRFGEMRELVAHIDEVVGDRARAQELPGLRHDLNTLINDLGFHDPQHAPTAERLLAEHDPDLARRIDQARIPDPGMLRPGEIDPDAVPTPHDLGRIQQLRELAERSEQIPPAARQADPAARARYDSTRREALALVERLGLREGTPGAAERRAIVDERLEEQTREQVDRLLADVGRPEGDLSDTDRQFVDTVRLEARAADALDFLSLPFHKAVMKVHQAYRTEVAQLVPESADPGAYRPTSDRPPAVIDNLVRDDSGARWFRWPPTAEESAEVAPASSPEPDIELPADRVRELPTDPEELHEHWSGLSPEEKDAWHREDPFIGNRDGIPQVDRDHYNRQTLAMLREQAEHTHNEERLKQIDDMLKLLDSAEEGLPEHFLSYVDDKLQYIYALGNPDTAQNIAIALAGAFRRRSGVGYAMQTLQQLRQAALAIDPTAETSVLLFGAYNNPDSLVATLSSKGAEDGALKVREFHDGLRATHEGPPANTTTIAHSYGGVTGGHSAGHGSELNTDALVFIGSWGTGVPNVADLRLTGVDPADIRDHVFATMAAYDSIQLMPPTHGPAPDDPAFGATVFESDSSPSPTRLGWNPDDHLATNYFSSHNQSYRSLGLIIAGYRDLLR
ncbi:hypothetical protein AB0N05_21825 [Nocardia sp. NPDC051030]|uniref:WXG100-like domain-containing protein n=1 Tax=Nocardia sp. NPDC051030 TaxID=3155162 RepID=UPI00341F4C5A